MQTHKAWMATTAASLSMVLVMGCKEGPEPISEVPPPPPSYEPQPMPPVSVTPSQPGGAGEDPYVPPAGGGSAEPEVIIGPGPAAPAGGQTYTVRKGDTLWAIATRVYGDGQRWVDIAQANPSVDPQKLAVGQQLVMP